MNPFLPFCAAVLALTCQAIAADTDKTPGRNSYALSSVKVGEDVKFTSEPITFETEGAGKLTVQVQLPVDLEPKWKTYYVHSFASKFRETVNGTVSNAVRLCDWSSPPLKELSAKWGAQELKSSPLESAVDAPNASYRHLHSSVLRWESEASKAAREHTDALKKKLGYPTN